MPAPTCVPTGTGTCPDGLRVFKDVHPLPMNLLVTTDGGTIDNVEDWGKRKLAFEIDDLTEGDYTLINFHADPTQIAELDRVLRINDAVKRHMIVRREDRD